MKRDRHQAIAKLSSGARDLLLFMLTKNKQAMLAAVVAVVAKCREFWKLLLTAGSGCGVLQFSAADDNVYYFGRSYDYEFSCSATPVAFAPAKGSRGRRRFLPPCVGGKQAREMLLETPMMSPGPVGVAGRGECSPPERSPQCWREQEINGLAEDFINRFYDQLRSQVEEEERRRRRLECRASFSPSP